MADEQTPNSTVEAAAPAAEAVNMAALEAKVATGLAAAFSGEPEGKPAKEPEPPATEIEAGVEEPQEEAEVEETPEAETIVEQSPEAPKAAGPTLPDSYKRTLKAYDWSDEDINAAFKANPASFTVTAQRLHANRTREIAQFAELGRRAQSKPEGEAKEKPTTFKAIDIDALVEKHGNEDLVREIAGPVNDLLKQLQLVLPDLNSGVKAIRESREQTLSKQVDNFFGDKGMTSYATVYGKDYRTATDEQVQNRAKVLEVADAVIAGAEMQGRQLDLHEALSMAHDSVSSVFKTAMIRGEIKNSVTKRAKGLTQKPVAKGDNAAGSPKTRDQLISSTAKKLDAIFKTQ